MSVNLCIHAYVIPRVVESNVRSLADASARALEEATSGRTKRPIDWEAARAAYVASCRTVGRELAAFRLPHGDNLFLEVLGAIERARGRELKTSCMSTRDMRALAAGLKKLPSNVVEHSESPKTVRRLVAWLGRVLASADGQALTLSLQDGVWTDSPDPAPQWMLARQEEKFAALRSAVERAVRKPRNRRS